MDEVLRGRGGREDALAAPRPGSPSAAVLLRGSEDESPLRRTSRTDRRTARRAANTSLLCACLLPVALAYRAALGIRQRSAPETRAACTGRVRGQGSSGIDQSSLATPRCNEPK